MNAETIEGLIPHAGRMCLLERVLDWSDDEIRCETKSHQWPDHPLRREGRLAAIHLIEYGAQAMAVHGGLLARARGQALAAGYLAGLRAIELHRDSLDDLGGPLLIRARRQAAIDASMMYQFEVSHDGQALAAGRITIAVQPGPAHLPT
ncbi:MAG: 3-hydroxylacyl-ACP dehydratase [Burkholderiaceae bacterium]